MSAINETYLRALVAAVREEVVEMVSWRDLPPVPPSTVRPEEGDHLVSLLMNGSRERLPEREVPSVSVTLHGTLVRVQAVGAALEIDGTEGVYHYYPDGLDVEQHAGLIAELWREEGR